MGNLILHHLHQTYRLLGNILLANDTQLVAVLYAVTLIWNIKWCIICIVKRMLVIVGGVSLSIINSFAESNRLKASPILVTLFFGITSGWLFEVQPLKALFQYLSRYLELQVVDYLKTNL